MKLQTKILVTFGAVMVVFCAALMGVRYYMTYKNRTVFESRTADKVVFFEHIAQTQSSTLEEFVSSHETADAVRAAVDARSAAPLRQYADIALPSFNAHALWACTRDFTPLFHLNANDDPRLERFPLDVARMQRFFLRGSYYRHFLSIHQRGCWRSARRRSVTRPRRCCLPGGCGMTGTCIFCRV